MLLAGMEIEMSRHPDILPSRAPLAIVAALLLGLVCGCGSPGNAGSPRTSAAPASPSRRAPIHGAYSPRLDPSDFVRRVDNPFFPLLPGTAFHYWGVTENGKTPQGDDEVVTSKTKKILGITATVVEDTVTSHGKPIERTLDWYAQDKDRNVWYLGEDTRELHHGRFVKMPDSWEAGVDGAQAGIIMPGHPSVGQAYRQEYYPGHALDQARVLGSGGRVTVQAGSYAHTLLTAETSPKLDPGVVERKYYAKGVGDVKEQTIKGNHERIELIRVTH
jgi:hypothetical protein